MAGLYQHLPYRMGVGIMMVNANHQVFVAKRIDTISEAWQMPQGGIDPGEEPHVAALRELKEETGTDKAAIIYEAPSWYDYDLPDHLVPQIWKGQYRGQRQKWFALRFLGVDSDINIHTDHPEFSEWKWVVLDELPNIIVPFKRELYQRLADDFRPVIMKGD